MSAIKEIEKTVLALPAEQHALLAEVLLSYLPPVEDDFSEAMKLEEAVRRDQEIETAQVQALSEEQFGRRVEAARKS